ncbi:MAG TPA: PKD domain-containing protein, partial [Bacteroidales bacterium]|nr:PKD domain-containing protein [Bacteroidales bacterium]
ANNPATKYYRWNFDYSYNNQMTLSKDTSVTFTEKGYHSISVYMYDKDYKYLGYTSNYAYVNGLIYIDYPKKACPGDEISVSYNSHGAKLTFNYGDGSPTSSSYSHVYSKAGKYAITVIGKGLCGTDTIKDSIQITGNLKMSGYFDVNLSTKKLCPTQPFNINIYTENNYHFEADLGDGTKISNSGYINHSYATEGTYLCNVKFQNACGSDTTIKNTIIVSKTNPWESLLVSKGKDVACPNELIGFSVNGNVAGVEWMFEDGGSTAGTSVNHLFKNTGKYHLTAKVTNYCGRDTLLKDSIEIKGDLRANFTNSTSIDDNVCPNSNVSLQYYGSTAPSLTWNFGDKDSSNYAYVNHVYSALGNYPVTLTLRNGCGADTVFKYTIHVIDKPVDVSSVTLSTDKACPGDLVYANINGVNDNIKSVKVDFGDGYFTNDKYYLGHVYLKSGNYPVKTEITNYCENKASRVDTIHIISNKTEFEPISFPTFSSTLCPGDQVSFQTNYYPSVTWDFGNGQKGYRPYATTSYSAAGTYNYSLTLTNGCGVDTTLKNTITVGNNTSISVYLTAYYPVTNTNTEIQFIQFGDASKVKWDFGDSTTSTFSSPVHSYKKEGTYYTKLTVTNGCNYSKTDSIKVTISDTLLLLTPKLIRTPKRSCPGDEVQFSTNYDFTNYYEEGTYDLNCGEYETSWQFADGSLSGATVSKVFPQAGKYPYSVKIKNKSGKEITLKDTVVVATGNTIRQGTVLIEGDTKKCPGDSAYFTLENAGKSYEIDFGDGHKISNFTERTLDMTKYKIVAHKYTAAGIYKVKVKATNGCGSVAYDSVSISIDQYKRSGSFFNGYYVDEYRTYCSNEKVKFNIYDAPNISIDFGDGENQLFRGANFSTIKHAYKTSGTYKAIVKVFGACNDTVVYTSFVTVDTCQALPDYVLPIKKEVMHCYPNPVQDKLIIELEDGSVKNASEYILFDLSGRKMLEGNIPKGSKIREINVSQLTTGIYLLHVSSNNKTEVIKVIKL